MSVRVMYHQRAIVYTGISCMSNEMWAPKSFCAPFHLNTNLSLYPPFQPTPHIPLRHCVSFFASGVNCTNAFLGNTVARVDNLDSICPFSGHGRPYYCDGTSR
ncbi:hypothetical protein NPIL_311801 [Nephila pilipes]|uniref:Uncharacterized protein n=1 Tax=Nephila pilipes TaxID=299642 RepID=A0A8X6NRB4_NEPPI|nr:hypothetical protein NPIL_311801 [Nephila pilipes]